MTRSIHLFTLLIGVSYLAGCPNNSTPTSIPQSAFMADFSLAALLEANKQFLVRTHEVSFGQGSGDSRYEKAGTATIEVTPGEVSAFMESLKSGVEDAIARSRAKIWGQGSGGTAEIQSFEYRYRHGQAHGEIHVWRVDGEGAKSHLIVLVVEK